MLGTKIYKQYSSDDMGNHYYVGYDEELYFKCAVWCNETGTATIEEHEEYYECVEIPPYIPTEAEIQAALTQAVQAHLDSNAQERNYDNIHTACTYINSSDPVFASEASALLLWRDKVWRGCYSILDDVKAGRRPIPSVSELLEELPSFSWPDEVTTEEQ